VGVLTDGRGERRRAETGWWRKNSGQHLGSARWSFPDAFPAMGRGSGGTARRRRSRDGVGFLWKKVGGSARQRAAAVGEGGSAWPSAAVLRERDTTTGAGRRRALGRARPRALSFIAGRDGGRGRGCDMAGHQWPAMLAALTTIKGRL
jgi:hypothetical protein